MRDRLTVRLRITAVLFDVGLCDGDPPEDPRRLQRTAAYGVSYGRNGDAQGIGGVTNREVVVCFHAIIIPRTNAKTLLFP